MDKNINIVIKDLRNLKIYDNLKEDPFFRDLLDVCRNDKTSIKKKQITIDDYKEEIIWFKHYKLQFLWLCFMYLYHIVFEWNFLDTSVLFLNIRWKLMPTLFFLVFFFSAIICLLNLIISWREHGLADVLQIIIICYSYYLIKFKEVHDYKVFIISLVLQIAIETLVSVFYYKKFKKIYIKHDEENKKLKKELADYEEFYNKTMKKADERISVCTEKLLSKGIEKPQTDRYYWWRNVNYLYPLRSGDKFNSVHIGNYEHLKSKKYEYYDYNKNANVKGETVRTTNNTYYKTYNIVAVPKAENYKALQKIKNDCFKSVYNFCIDDALTTEYNIYAVECTCELYIYNEEQDSSTAFNSPTDAQINEARKQIDEKYDKRERLQNVLEHNRDYTTKEMMDRYGFTNERYLESVESDYLRKRDTNHYIQKNSGSEHNSYNRNWSSKKTSICTIMYIVDGCLFYSTKKEKDMWPEDDFSCIETKGDFYETREEEIEAIVDYLMKRNPAFAKNIIENSWSWYSDLASKIMHTVANDTSLLNWFN